MGTKVASSAPTNVLPETGEPLDPITHVERALRSDAWLEDQDVAEAMRVYLGLRSRRARVTRADEAQEG